MYVKFRILIFLNLFVLDKVSSEEFNNLKKPVNIIDDDYRIKWTSTAVQEKHDFFYKSDYIKIFQDLPALQLPLGYTLVRISSGIISIYFTFYAYIYIPNSHDMKILCFKIHADFSISFKKPDNILKNNWPPIAEQIINLAKLKKADACIKNILKEHKDCETNGESFSLDSI